MLKKLLFAAVLVIVATATNAQTFIWEENFDADDALPTGWSQKTAASDGGWLVGKPEDLSSAYYGVPSLGGNAAITNDDACNCDKSKDSLLTPTIDLSTQAGAELLLIFDVVYYDATYQGFTENLKLLASEDGGATWATLLSPLSPSFNWGGVLVDISAYAGKPNIKFAFVYNDGGGYLYGAAIDNVKIAIKDDVVRAKSGAMDFSRYITDIPGYIPASNKALPATELFVSGAITNTGFPNITSFDATLNYGGTSVTKNFSGLNVKYNTTYSFDFDNAVVVGMGSTDIGVTISNINGGADDNPADNSVAGTVKGLSPSLTRKVVAEEGTGTWCQWCPRGAVMMDYMTKTYPDNFIGIAVHNSTTDPMRLAAYDSPMSQILPGYPGGLVERVYNVDPLEFEKFMFERLDVPAKVFVTQQVTFDSATRTATVHSKLNFTEEMNGDYRITVVFIEDGVKGTATGYAQKNAYAGGANGPMGGYESKPATVPASQMIYDHVARALIGGFNGAAGSVPTNNPAGSEHFYKTTYTNIQPAYNVNKMHAITMVFDNVTGEIINSESTIVPNVLVSANEPVEITSVSMFPNPVQNEATLQLQLAEVSDLQVRIVDMLGKVYVENNYSSLSGEQQLPIRTTGLAAGTYMVTVSTKNHTVAKPFVVVR